MTERDERPARAPAAPVAATSDFPEPAPEPRQRRVASLATSLGALAGFSALAIVYFAGAWADPAHRIVGSRGDPSLFVWYLRWVPWAIAHGHNPLYSPALNAPHGVNLMWNTSMLLPGVVLAPVTALWGPVVTYDVLATASLALSSWTAWIALRRILHVGPGAATAGALVFGFGPFMISQVYGHLHLSAAWFVPLLVLAAHEVCIAQERSVRRGGFVLGIVAAAQLLTGEELLVLTLIAVALGLVALGAFRPADVRVRLGHIAGAAPWAGGTFLLLGGLPLAYQFLGRQVVHGPVQPQDHYVTDLLAPVTPTQWQWIHTAGSIATSNRFEARGAELSAYVGIPLIALVLVTVWVWRRHRAVWAALVATLGVVVLSFGPHLHVKGRRTGVWLPWSIVHSVPTVNSVLPVRLMVGVDLALAGFVALAAHRAWRVPDRRRRLVACGAVLAALVATMPVRTFRASPVSVPAFFTGAGVTFLPQGRLAIVAPYPEPDHVETMRWQAAAEFRFRMLGGYALVPDPHGRPSFVGADRATRAVLDAVQLGEPPTALPPAWIAGMIQEMHDLRPASVIVGPMTHRDAVISLFEWMLGRRPVETGGVALWTPVDSVLGQPL